MSYQKQTWENGVSKLNATRLNHMEDGIEEASITAANAEASAGTANAELLNILKLAEAYDPTDSYDEDDVVKYEGTFYRCIGATTGQWDSSKWTVLTLDWLVPRSTLTIIANGGYNVKGYKKVLVKVFDPGTIQTVVEENIGLTSQSLPLTVLSKALLDYVGGMCQKVNQHRRVAYGSIDERTGQYRLLGKEDSIGLVYGHKYFVSFNAVIESDNTTILRFKLGASGYSQFLASVSNGLNQQIGELVTASGPAEDSSYFATYSSGYTHFSYSNLRIVDLSAIWPGNEPTSTSDPRIQWLMSYLASHPEYDAGSIITAPVTMAVSKGFNLWDEQWEEGYIAFQNGQNSAAQGFTRSKGYISVIPNETYCYHCGADTTGIFFFYTKDKTFITGLWTNNRLEVLNNNTFTIPSNAFFVRFYTSAGYGGTYNHDICINVSSSLNGTYMPYRAPIEYPIPAEVRALDGYGYGVDSDYYNYIDFANKKFVKKVARVDLGSLNWRISTTNVFYCTNIPNLKRPASASALLKGLCSKYNVADQTHVYQNIGGAYDKCFSGLDWTDGIQIRDSSYTDAATFGAAMSGVHLYYELATPVETDISEYIDSDLPDGNLIDVTAGGYLEFENENDLAVPYELTYQYRVVEAASNDVGE